MHLQPHPTALDWHRGAFLSSSRSRAKEAPRRQCARRLPAFAEDQDEDRPLFFTDKAKESGRRYRRRVFDHSNWEAHRSTSRYQRHLVTLLGSRVAQALTTPVLAITAIASALVTYESLLEAGLLPANFSTLAVNASSAGDVTSFALSLLLVFRTSASYDRWDEARKLWGAVVNRSRDLARQALIFMPAEEGGLRTVLQRWAIAYPKVLMDHMRDDIDLHQELEDVLLPVERDMVLSAKHRPLYVTMMISTIVRNARLADTSTVRLEENVSALSDTCGACERLFKSPIPPSWTRHTSRFLMLWLATIPFTLYSSRKWATIPVAAVTSYLLLGIEEIGVSIEEPFSILPLESLTDLVKANIREMAAQSEQVEELARQEQLVGATARTASAQDSTASANASAASL